MNQQQTNGNTALSRRADAAPATRAESIPAERAAELVWSGQLKPHEKAAVVALCQRFALNPFLGHVHVLGGRIYVGIDGWFEIANRHPQFDGYDLRVLTRDEKDAMLAGEDDVMFEAKVYRKDRSRPAVAFGRANRANTAAELRGQKLVIEVAQARALRKALRSAFRVTEMDLPDDDDQRGGDGGADAPDRDYAPFWQAVGALGVSHERVHEILGVQSVTQVADLRAAYKAIKAAVQAHRVEQARGPMTRESFLALAYDLGARDKHHVAELLAVKHLDDWGRQGRSWEDAHAYVAGRLTQPEPGAEVAADGETMDAEPVSAEAPLHLDDVPF